MFGLNNVLGAMKLLNFIEKNAAMFSQGKLVNW